MPRSAEKRVEAMVSVHVAPTLVQKPRAQKRALFKTTTYLWEKPRLNQGLRTTVVYVWGEQEGRSQTSHTPLFVPAGALPFVSNMPFVQTEN